MAENIYSGADVREDSMDSFKTDEGEIEDEKRNENTSKSAVESVMEKGSEDKKKESSFTKRSDEKKLG